MIPVRAVVFAYHDIGVRCLESLIELGIEISLVLTHQDNPSEEIWFASVESVAKKNKLPVISPSDPNAAEVVARIAALRPDFLFSFYYRSMLGEALLRIPSKGAFNLHGSLLPKYRGRVPLNWAIIMGETHSGVSLHRMEIKPDAGNLVAQSSVPILINDTAQDVFRRLVCAAESTILETVPGLIDGSAEEIPQDLSRGSYFGGRGPQDGRIDWNQSARQIHDLIRAVAPPYPGAFFDIDEQRVFLMGSYFGGSSAATARPRIYWRDGVLWADCADGGQFRITDLRVNGVTLTEATFREIFGEEIDPPLQLVNGDGS